MAGRGHSDYLSHVNTEGCATAVAVYSDNKKRQKRIQIAMWRPPKAGGQTARGRFSTVWVIAGYQPQKTSRNSPFSVVVRVCSSKCAPRFVHRICCFLTIRASNPLAARLAATQESARRTSVASDSARIISRSGIARAAYFSLFAGSVASAVSREESLFISVCCIGISHICP
jgi:hypothetical protein